MNYRINEIFYSVQGEGRNTGRGSVFVRFAGCNLQCQREPGPLSPGGFDCDTDFSGGREMELPEILQQIDHLTERVKNHSEIPVIFTGGEPALQLDEALLASVWSADHSRRKYLPQIETNGTQELPAVSQEWLDEFLPVYYQRGNLLMQPHSGPITGRGSEPAETPRARFYPFDWITISPKTAEHTLQQLKAHELRYVRSAGQALPKPRATAHHKYLSPVFNPSGSINAASVEWCLQMVRENPSWRLSLQTHKFINAR